MTKNQSPSAALVPIPIVARGKDMSWIGGMLQLLHLMMAKVVQYLLSDAIKIQILLTIVHCMGDNQVCTDLFGRFRTTTFVQNRNMGEI
uniref:Uncharacterized protein n=1 Tax=Pyxicephalus adspersus TaxID=30357 RepID=A0AAV2ZUM0_PYXAD|nr:TPA: hypothetical protein GDO54_003730 [Pyxicephalus adspersus]